MEKQYHLKLKKGDLEIEVSGSEKEFVIQNYDKIIAQVEDSKTFKPSSAMQSSITEDSKQNSTTTKEISGGVTDDVDLKTKFAKDAGVSLDDLNNVYDFTGDEIIIHKILKGTGAEKHKIIAKLALIAHFHINKTESLTGRAIGKYLTDLGVEGTSNLATNLKKEKGIRKIKSKYKLNQFGKKEAYNLIKELSKI